MIENVLLFFKPPFSLKKILYATPPGKATGRIDLVDSNLIFSAITTRISKRLISSSGRDVGVESLFCIFKAKGNLFCRKEARENAKKEKVVMGRGKSGW